MTFRISYFLTLLILSFSLQSATVSVSTIEQLDDLAEFSFSVMSDNNGFTSENYIKFDDSRGLPMHRMEQWVKANDVFCIGNGDLMASGRNNLNKICENDTWWGNNFYPTIGDNCNSTNYGYSGTGDQAEWGRGWTFFNSLNNFFSRVEFRQPLNTPVYSNVAKGNDTLVPYDDQYLDYYATRQFGAFTVHMIMVYYPDPGVFAERSKDFMMDKIYSIAASKSNYDLVLLIGHKANFLQVAQSKGYISRSERDAIMTTADFVCEADSHKYQRVAKFDADYDGSEAIWMNSGSAAAGGTQGYLNLHVFDNPPRFTVQYIDTHKKDSRALHVGTPELYSSTVDPANAVAMLKYINGPFQPVDWNVFEVDGSVPPPPPPPPEDDPVVSFNTPSGNMTIYAGDDLYVKVDAADGNGIDRVFLDLNGSELLRSEGGAPYEWGASGQNDPDLQNMQVGTYTLKARAKDMLGNWGESQSITITVADEVVLPPGAIHVEAEDFSLNSGFNTQATQDLGGGLNTSHASVGDFLEYTLNIEESGTYEAVFRVASLSRGAKFEFKHGTTVLCSVDEPATGDYQVWTTTAPQNINLPSGNLTLTILATGDNWNMNWFEMNKVSGSIDPYTEWKNANSILDDDGDDDGDGVSNLMEFALGGNPKHLDSAAIKPDIRKNDLDFDFMFKRNESTVTYIIESSSDLSNWIEHTRIIDDRYGVVGSDCSVPVPLSGMTNGKLFLRLKIEQ